MIDFYAYLRGGEDKSQALRNAALQVKKGRSHPYFWGSFISLGDPQ